MIGRRKKIILVQVSIFLIATSLLYSTYRDKNKETQEVVKIKSETDSNINVFNDIEYSGFDLNGNRYTLKADVANFNTDTAEIINMEQVTANFYLKDDTILKVVSDKGFYNNVTLDMKFSNNVEATYLSNTIISDQLDYSNSKGKLLASGNVKGESVEKGEFIADNVEYEFKNKTLNFSMFGKKQVNIKIKN